MAKALPTGFLACGSTYRLRLPGGALQWLQAAFVTAHSGGAAPAFDRLPLGFAPPVMSKDLSLDRVFPGSNLLSATRVHRSLARISTWLGPFPSLKPPAFGTARPYRVWTSPQAHRGRPPEALPLTVRSTQASPPALLYGRGPDSSPVPRTDLPGAKYLLREPMSSRKIPPGVSGRGAFPLLGPSRRCAGGRLPDGRPQGAAVGERRGPQKDGLPRFKVPSKAVLTAAQRCLVEYIYGPCTGPVFSPEWVRAGRDSSSESCRYPVRPFGFDSMFGELHRRGEGSC